VAIINAVAADTSHFSLSSPLIRCLRKAGLVNLNNYCLALTGHIINQFFLNQQSCPDIEKEYIPQGL
jgi:hypothetical protein